MLLPEWDFETYSAAGYVWNPAAGRYEPPKGARKKGLSAVGEAVYTEHPTAEVLTLSYDLREGLGVRRWRPGLPLPTDLIAYLQSGGPIEAHNAMFERLCYWNICIPKYGFPEFSPYQQRCSMAKARVQGLPGALGNLSDVLRLPVPKDAEGKKLLDEFSVPRNPTKKDARHRVMPTEAPERFEKLQAYCDTDILAERGASDHMTPMSDDEQLFWWIDQEINWRGVGVDRPAIRDCLAVLEAALEQYGEEFRAITGGLDPTQLQAAKGWLAGRGVYMASMDKDAIDEALARPGLDPLAHRVLTIRSLIGSASVKKLYAMETQASRDDRLRNLIVHHGARTGRPTGEGPQPLNLPKAGPDLAWCASCGQPCAQTHARCPSCGASLADARRSKWSAEAVDSALEIMAARDLATVEWFFGDALLTISGCIRGLFVAGPGQDLIASDYSAIEAVVIAELAGETWRQEAFQQNLPIYLLSASKITGTSLDAYQAYKTQHGDHHPDRQKIGKVAELACGFGGWIGSYKAFGSTEPDDVIKAQILAWREASPAIVEFWGGQYRGLPWDRNRRQECFGVEGMAVQAILNPGVTYTFRGLQFLVRPTPAGDQALIVTLLSGRELTYQMPQLVPSMRREGEWSIRYMTWNSNPKYGAMGWVPMETYGGRLTENIVQATAHDVLRFGIINLRAAGYPTVLHVYDEVVVEVPQGTGSVAQVEAIMATMPPWAVGWPIRAAGGWRGRRYRKG